MINLQYTLKLITFTYHKFDCAFYLLCITCTVNDKNNIKERKIEKIKKAEQEQKQNWATILYISLQWNTVFK